MDVKRPVILCASWSFPHRVLEPNKSGPGGVLHRLLHSRTGASASEYIAAFDRRTIRYAGDLTARRVLVLGGAARIKLGLSPLLAEPMVVDGVTYRQLPMPNSRTKWYRDPVCAELAALVLEEMYMGWVNSLGE